MKKFPGEYNLGKHGKFVEEFHGESDRAAAVLAGAYMDNILQQLIYRFLIDDQKRVSSLFKGMGPLASFFARIEVAYALGLLTIEEHEDIHIIRRIRNHFAHHIDGPKFADKSVISSASRLHWAKEIRPEEPETKGQYTRRLFLLTVAILSFQLGSRNIKRVKGP